MPQWKEGVLLVCIMTVGGEGRLSGAYLPRGGDAHMGNKGVKK